MREILQITLPSRRNLIAVALASAFTLASGCSSTPEGLEDLGSRQAAAEAEEDEACVALDGEIVGPMADDPCCKYRAELADVDRQIRDMQNRIAQDQADIDLVQGRINTAENQRDQISVQEEGPFCVTRYINPNDGDPDLSNSGQPTTYCSDSPVVADNVLQDVIRRAQHQLTVYQNLLDYHEGQLGALEQRRKDLLKWIAECNAQL